MTAELKQNLRRELREKRRSLDGNAQRLASRHLDQRLRKLPLLRKTNRLAFYIASDGEISPLPTLIRLSKQGKRCYLPCVSVRARLQFRRYRPRQSLKRNRFQIPEPSARNNLPLPLHQLDVIFMPLVGFDNRGNRLGMGGGFYDRTLANTEHDRPLLIGLAHSCQQVQHLPVESWDIPLDAIVTDRETIIFRIR